MSQRAFNSIYVSPEVYWKNSHCKKITKCCIWFNHVNGIGSVHYGAIILHSHHISGPYDIVVLDVLYPTSSVARAITLYDNQLKIDIINLISCYSDGQSRFINFATTVVIIAEAVLSARLLGYQWVRFDILSTKKWWLNGLWNAAVFRGISGVIAQWFAIRCLYQLISPGSNVVYH